MLSGLMTAALPRGIRNSTRFPAPQTSRQTFLDEPKSVQETECPVSARRALASYGSAI